VCFDRGETRERQERERERDTSGETDVEEEGRVELWANHSSGIRW
jgi:hypothetical protein